MSWMKWTLYQSMKQKNILKTEPISIPPSSQDTVQAGMSKQ